MIVIGIIAIYTFSYWQFQTTLRSAAAASDPATVRFHQLLNAGAYEQIMRESQIEGNAEDATGVLSLVHRKLGNAGPCVLDTIEVVHEVGYANVKIVCATRFEKGKAEETFTFKHLASGDIVLTGYHADSEVFARD
ncbi:MAG: hypothetical protein ACRD3E_19900 [Terriglobales bacterium]